MYGFGFGAMGRLGNGRDSNEPSPRPVIMDPSKRVIRATCGIDHSLLVVETI